VHKYVSLGLKSKENNRNKEKNLKKRRKRFLKKDLQHLTFTDVFLFMTKNASLFFLPKSVPQTVP